MASIPIIGPIWFLPALFWSTTFYSLLKKHYKDFDLFCHVCLFFIVSYLSIQRIRLPFSIQAGMSAVLYLWVGDMIKSWGVLDKTFNNKSVLVALFILWMICVISGGVYVSRCVYNLGLISLIGSLSGSLLFLKFVKINKIGGGILGRLTLYVLCIHQVVQYLQCIYGNPFQELKYIPVLSLLIEFSFQVAIVLVGTFLIVKIRKI